MPKLTLPVPVLFGTCGLGLPPALGQHGIDRAGYPRLVARAVADKRDQYTLATKFGFDIDDAGQITNGLNGGPEYIRKSIDRSLKNLGTDYVDLYCLHRMDPNTPIEETVGAMSRLVEAGKVRYIGLSEVPADVLRRAHGVHPITALETKYSLFDQRAEEEDILRTTRALGIGFVAYSPLGRGFLSGDIKTPDDFEADDFRRFFPRYQGENFYKNLALVHKLQALAQTKAGTAAPRPTCVQVQHRSAVDRWVFTTTPC